MQTITTSSLTLDPLIESHADKMFLVLSDLDIYRYLD